MREGRRVTETEAALIEAAMEWYDRNAEYIVKGDDKPRGLSLRERAIWDAAESVRAERG